MPGLKSGWAIATQALEAADEEGAAAKRASIAYPAEDWHLENAGSDDFVGVQAYTRNIVGPEGVRPPADGVETTLTGWEYFRMPRSSVCTTPERSVVQLPNGAVLGKIQSSIYWETLKRKDDS